jgi:hypothetical protein
MPLDVALALAGLLRGGAVLMRRGALAVKDFIFKVNLVAVVRVRAADENIARQVVPNVSERQAPLKLDWLTRTMLRRAMRKGNRCQFLCWND